MGIAVELRVRPARLATVEGKHFVFALGFSITTFHTPFTTFGNAPCRARRVKRARKIIAKCNFEHPTVYRAQGVSMHHSLGAGTCGNGSVPTALLCVSGGAQIRKRPMTNSDRPLRGAV